MSPDLYSKLTSADMQTWHNRFYRPSRIVVAVAGAEHREVMKCVEKQFGKYPKYENNGPHLPPSIYTGGDIRNEIENPPKANPQDRDVSHVLLGFEGVNFHDNNLIAMACLHVLLGGGGSFSAGGPGKGMYSRLYRNLLNGYGFVEAAQSFSASYKEKGLFGIYTSVDHGSLLDGLEVMCLELVSVIHNVSIEEFQRAQNQLKSSILMGLETRATQADDIGRQIITYGKRISAVEICRMIDNLTIKDVQNCLKRSLSSKPTLVAIGRNTASLPKISDVHSIFLPHLK